MRKVSVLNSALLVLALAGSPLLAQQSTQAPANDSMPGMNMPSGGESQPSGQDSMRDMPGMTDGGSGAMRSMQDRHMDMGPHMKMTTVRPLQPGDQQKADEIVQAARAAAEHYADYRVALDEGYKIFLPNVPQKQYHFTNYRNAFYARNHFDASRSTSLLYEKQGDGYKLIGVMYTAKKGASEDELNARVPLSIAQWHAHVNFCMPPRDRKQEAMVKDSKFGFAGSITTQEACDAAGGKFYPQIFGWMVHVYPFEKTQAEIWSVERQHNHMD